MKQAICGLFFTLSTLAATAEPQKRLVLPVPDLSRAEESCRGLGLLERFVLGEIALEQTFFDGFDSFAPGTRWTPHYDHNAYDDWRARTLTGNNEAQIYVDKGYSGSGDAPLGLSPFSTRNGILSITAAPTPSEAKAALHPFAFTSGVITTRASHLQRYGYFEIRARVPKGQGLWPAFWMLQPGKWPPELDVFEILGHEPGRVHMHVHFERQGTHVDVPCKRRVASPDRQFHTYGVLWTPDALVRYVDRKPVAVTATPPGLDEPMYMIANLAVGGDWPGQPDETTSFPAAFEIDWIAAWRLEGAAQ